MCRWNIDTVAAGASVTEAGKDIDLSLPPLAFATGASEMAERVRTFDWSTTPLGPAATWPESLRTAVGICLSSQLPMFVWWGPELINIYNDAYAPVLGKRHPHALGQRAAEVWQDIWPAIAEDVESVVQRGIPIVRQRVRFVMERNGYPEETFFTYSHSPIPDGCGGIGGLFQVCTDETASVLAERERDKAEAALRANEQHWRGIFERLHEGFILGEVVRAADGQVCDWRYLQMNAAWEYLTGLSRSTALERTIREVLPDLEPVWVELLAHVVDTGEPATFTQFSASLGRSYEVHAFRPEPERFAMIFLDVTERMRAQAERERLLQEVEAERERLAEVFRRAPSFMCILTGPEHVFTLANDRYCELVGHRDLLHKTAREAFPEIEGQGQFELLDHVFQTGQPHIGNAVPVLLQRDSGRPPEERFLDFVYQPFRGPDGAVVGIFVQGIDLTERVLAEEALRAKTERLDLLLDNIHDYGVLISDAEGTIIEWQGGAERITGYRVEEAVGRSIDTLFSPEDRAAGIPQLERQTAASEGRAPNKRWHIRKDGSRFFADGVMVALRDEQGEFRGFGKVFRDATAQEQAEEALREADRRKDQFLATLAHELRNPLAPISNVLQVWPLIENDRSQTEQMRGLIDRQIRQMIRLIDDLLDVSRISRGKIELRKQRLDLATIIAGALEGVRPFVEQCEHTLTVELPPQPVALEGDAGRLMQVFANLINNAAKYTGHGGQIWISAAREGRLVRVSVRDNGPGIPADQLTAIFEMFAQVDQTLDRAHGGLGIGLTLVKTLVELHGGTVEAQSGGLGLGSEFVVRLPAEPSTETVITMQPGFSLDAVALPPCHRVLVVDDLKPSADTLALMLGALGQAARVAYDGEAAIAAAATYLPDVVFLDIAMPGMDGYEVARQLRQSLGSNVVLVALTGYGQEQDRQRAFAAGFDQHLIKPTSVDALHHLLSNLPTPS